MRKKREEARSSVTAKLERNILKYLYEDATKNLKKLIHIEVDNIAKSSLANYSPYTLYFIRQYDQNYFSSEGDHEPWEATEIVNADDSKTSQLKRIGNMLTEMLKERFIVANYTKNVIASNTNLNNIDKYFPHYIESTIKNTLTRSNYPENPGIAIEGKPSIFQINENSTSPGGVFKMKGTSTAIKLIKQRIFQNELIDKM